MAISILAPAAMWGAAAWFDYETTIAHAREYVRATTTALAEQADESLQTADIILARMLDHVQDMDWETIGKSREVHDFLADMAHGLPQVQSIFFVAPDGSNSASSRAFPMEHFDDRARDYYRAAVNGNSGLFVSAAFRGQMTGQAGFTVSRPRITRGRFDGIVAVTFSPSYFQAFYRRTAVDPKTASAALVRSDGRLLVRQPDAPHLVTQLPPTHAVMRAAASGAEEGVVFSVSSTDHRERLTGFRRVRGQPLLAAFGLPRSAYLAQWYLHVAWMAVFAALTSLALAFASRGVLRRAEAEEQTLRLLLAESEGRKEAESKVQHLQKMEALGRLSGGVAHDFNNLLAAVLGSLELALKRLEQPERARRLIATAMQAAERGARLTGQMLAFSRNKDVVPRPIDVNEVIRMSEDLLQRTVEVLVRISCDLS